jgi:cytochrome P450
VLSREPINLQETLVTETGAYSNTGTVFDDAGGAAMNDNPQPLFTTMRAVGHPIATGSGVLAMRRVDVEEVLRDHEKYSSAQQVGRMGQVRPLLPMEVDTPDHRKYRKIIDPLFAPAKVAPLEEKVVKLTNELIDTFIDDREIDFAKQFSTLLPTQIFLAILGLPVEDLPLFLRLKDGAIRPHDVVGKPMDHPDTRAFSLSNGQAIYDYYSRVLDAREAEPRDDLLTQFLTFEVEGHKLTREEILDFCFLLLTAGLDTVTASLDCFFVFLAEHPALRAQLAADPEVAKPAVEELLRWESPVQLVSRVAMTDTDLGGCPVHKGDAVYTFLGAANTDGEGLDTEGGVTFDREINRHIAFGSGPHRCLGSHLARMELKVILNEWHRRIPHYRLAPDQEIHYTSGVRSIDSFRLVLGESL